jgi:hypothetical protein
MSHRVFCKKCMRMCTANSILVDENKLRSEEGNIKHWQLKCGCVVKDIEGIKVHIGYFLKDGTRIINPATHKKWEMIPPRQ